MNETNLKKYANLLVCAGGNVQKGQLVVISSDIRDANFARMVANCAYDARASDVVMFWTDDVLARTKYLRADNSVFDSFPQWIVDRYKHYDDKGAVYLMIDSSDPDLLAGVDLDRIKRYSKVAREATKEHSALTMKSALRWSICALPSPAWAKKVFPKLSETEAMDKLWELILKCSRADGDDPIADWAAHKQNFVKRVDYLNRQQFSALRLTTGLGTDLTIGLAKNHCWTGGGSTDKDGLSFFPNMPTEEIFTMPDRNYAEGKVVASMPLSYQGNLIEDFEIEFRNGKVSDYKAGKNREILTNIIEMDEGASRLGEVAIVANSSPISQTGVLFYNTLFDENASSHLALGKAYPKNIEGGNTMTAEELTAAGVNESLVHVDFMFGTADMCIVGINEDGSETVFFENGEYV